MKYLITYYFSKDWSEQTVIDYDDTLLAKKTRYNEDKPFLSIKTKNGENAIINMKKVREIKIKTIYEKD